jgi:AcrR family transcriptional regulator
VARTQDQRKAETRRRLLAAAAELFAREGYDAVSVDAVADVAERTSGSVYAHFGGKQGMLEALLDGFQDDMAAAVAAAFAAHPDLPSRVLALWRNVAVPVGGDAWFLLESELWLHAVRDPSLGNRLRDRYRSVHRLMGDEFAAWADEFALTPAVPRDHLGMAVMTAVVGLGIQHRLDPAVVPDDIAVTVLLAPFGAISPVTD